MPHLICYDITSNSLRTRLGKKIIQYGLDRINKSVYLGAISPSSLTQLSQYLQQQLSQKGGPLDSCIIIEVGARHIHEMTIIGLNELDKGELSGDKSTLIV